SLLSQSYGDIEIILVDDGSPDNCPDIVDEYAKKDSRIVALHKENGGLSDARNAGLAVSKGEYISFVDSDDFVDKNFIKTLLNALNKNNSDIVECGVKKFYEGEDVTPGNNTKAESYENSDGIEKFLFSDIFTQTVWNKLYRREVISDITFEKGKTNEDEFWTYQIFARAKKVTRFFGELYFYLQRPGSIMGEKYNLKRLDCLEAYKNRYLFIKENYPQFEKREKINLCGAYIYHYQFLYRTDDISEKEKYLTFMYENFKDFYSKDLYKDEKFSAKLWVKIFNKNPKFTSKIRNSLKVGM
ncbi:MAG: glycosyltransferase, partial [Acutalibacteraceae bacterium]